MNMPAVQLTEGVRNGDWDEPGRSAALGGFSAIPVATSPSHRFYLRLPAKFAIALGLAGSWTALSIWLSLTWVEELAAVTHIAFAVIAITFIAYVPGFMNAFLLSTLLLDRKPPRRAVVFYPGITILVAAYNEAAAIRDTLSSLAVQDYPGAFARPRRCGRR